MLHPLDGCWAKIERANEHIQYLTTELQRFLDESADRYRVEVDFDRKTLKGKIKAYAVGDIDVPLRLAIIVGEVLHHLRTSLDHLVWALALRKHASPSSKIAFPICETAEKFKTALKNGIVRGVSKPTIALIDSVQPYRTAAPVEAPLFILHTLNNTEKHRLLLVAFCVVCQPDHIKIDPGRDEITFILPTADLPFMVKPTKDGAELFPFGLNRFDDSVKLHFNLPRTVSFDKVGPVKPESVVPRLVQLRDETVKTLELFRSEF